MPVRGKFRVSMMMIGSAMMGDDPARDIVPAQSVGLSVWHITTGDDDDGAKSPLHGTLSDFHAWVRAGNLDTFSG